MPISMSDRPLPIRNSPKLSTVSDVNLNWVIDTDYVPHGSQGVSDQDLENVAQGSESGVSSLSQSSRDVVSFDANDQIAVSPPRSPSPWQSVLAASIFDPFQTLPVPVDKVTNDLLHFYMLQTYWQTAYALSPKVKPSMKGSWEQQTENSNSHFHILMARSALHQLHINGFLHPRRQKDLEFAALKHQTSAVSRLRNEISRGSKANKLSILVSVISLATFEMRYTSQERAFIHFKAARDMIKQLGSGGDGYPFRGQPGLQSALHQALWFEGIYDDPRATFLWDPDNLSVRWGWLNELLDDVDQIWRNRQLLPIKTRKSFVLPKTRFHEFIMRDTAGEMISIYHDISEGVAQQRSIIILLCVIAALYHDEIVKAYATPTGPEFKVFSSAVLSYSVWVEDMLTDYDLDDKSAEGDLLWLLLHDFSKIRPRSSNEAALDALYRVDFYELHWRASGMSNVLKNLTKESRSRLLKSMLAFIDGKRYDGRVTLE